MSASGLRLQKLGGRYQILLETAEDLEQLLTLDEAHWAATSLPNDILACDPLVLEHMDHDDNGRVRVDELREAVVWCLHRLKDRSHLMARSSALRLSAINTDHEEGKAIKRTAQRVLTNLGVEAPEITLAQLRDRKSILASGAANGDGVIPPSAIPDEEVVAFANDIMNTLGSGKDLSGSEGVTRELLDAFLEAAEACLEREGRARPEAGSDTSVVLPLGANTAEAFAAFAAVEAKLDHYFALCALAQVDERVCTSVAFSADELEGLEHEDAESLRQTLRDAPIAVPTPDEALAIDESVNPYWREPLGVFTERVLAAFVKEDQISHLRVHVWERIKTAFQPYREWAADTAGATVRSLDSARLRGYLEGDLADRLRAIMAEDEAVAEELNEIRDVEKLVLYQQWLLEIANNFAAWPHLYDPKVRSLVEQGTLVMDGRRFGLCVRVTDRKRHRAIAEHSQLCLLYCDIHRVNQGKAEDVAFSVAVAVTSGTMNNLFVGKQGLFIARDGVEMDAVVADVLRNPVSLWEALKQPFRRIAEFLGKQAERFTSSRYADVEKGLDSTVSQMDKSVQANLQKPDQPKSGTNGGSATAVRDVLLGGSVAVAALGGTLAMVSQTIHNIGLTGVLKALLGISALVAAPTLIVAWVKLRRRNLSMLLEACGVAMNKDMILKPSTGFLFTRIPERPPADEIRRNDLTRQYLRSLPESARRNRGLLLAVLLGLAIGISVGVYQWQVEKQRFESRRNTSAPSSAPAKGGPASEPKTDPAGEDAPSGSGDPAAGEGDVPPDSSPTLGPPVPPRP